MKKIKLFLLSLIASVKTYSCVCVKNISIVVVSLVCFLFVNSSYANELYEKDPDNFIRYPIYYGTYNAPNTIIFYHNFLCPYCSMMMPTFKKFIESLNPEEFKLIIQGASPTKTANYYYVAGALLAKKNVTTAFNFFIEAAGHDNRRSLENLNNLLQKYSDFSSFPELIKATKDKRNNILREQGRFAIKYTYKLKSTPQIVINRKVFPGDTNNLKELLSFAKKMKKTPDARIP